ncbi:MAG: DUF86 domain-containing protein [candidate division KSB1 bacterium]|nr:DUF86 domain-containing protein [candidate division KSB1 bacterium]
MPPHIVKNKLEQLASLIEDLKAFESISYQEFLEHHHSAVERILELLVVTAHDALLHVFSLMKEDTPTTYRMTFLRAGEPHILPEDLAKRLAEAAGKRNLLVHGYSTVDLEIIYNRINSAIQDFAQFNQHLAAYMKLT